MYNEGIKHFDYSYQDIQFQINKIKLPIVVRRSRTGFEAYDMTLHPQLLIAGETGSGKSTALRSILTAIIQSKKNIKLHLG